MEDRVSKSQFKARALEMFRQVEMTGEPVIVTDHGVPTIEVRPYRGAEYNPLDILRDSVTEYIAPTAPVAEDEWEASK